MYLVELDLEKFFDKVNHDKLMSLQMCKVSDKNTVKLIHQYLRSGIMKDGVVSQRTEWTPQGNPLSLLLSNIIHDELDKELSSRGHSFVRYADYCSIYVRSEKSAYRVLTSITTYLEERLKLKVNRDKSMVNRPTDSTLLGFSFYNGKGKWAIRVAKKSIECIKAKSNQITEWNNGSNNKEKLLKMKPVIHGWVNYFSKANAKSITDQLDASVRTRFRIGLWKEWKSCKTKVINLLKLKASRQKAYEWGNSSRGYCRVAHSPILCATLNNPYFRSHGYEGFADTYRG